MKRVLAVLLLLLVPATAHAEDPPPFTIGAKPAWYLLAGVTTGATTVAHDRGGYVGGEASLVRLGAAGRYFGFYGDGYHDIGAARTYATLGPELGYKIVGIDLGGATRLGGARAEWGATGRLFLSVGVVSVYGRYAYFIDSLGHDNEHVVQIGALVKIPFKIWGVQ